MVYVLTDGGDKVVTYPYSATDLVRSMPNTSWPARPLTDEELADFNVFPVSDVPPPSFDKATQIVVEINPALVNGTWVRQWSVVTLSEQEKADRAPHPSKIDEERDRRIESGITFNGVLFQNDAGSRENIAGASTLALAAIVSGAQPGDYRWHGGPTDFVWIAADNSQVVMDAHTVLAFGTAMANHKANLIWRARALKDMDPTPLDYRNDIYWT